MPLPEGVTFADPHQDIDRHRKNLPHWQQDGVTYFLTYRLADSLPESKLTAWQAQRSAWLLLHPKPWNPQTEADYHQQFSASLERWLDEGYGSCLLRDDALAGEVVDVMTRFDGERCSLHSWIVMPNHVHALFSLRAGHRLEDMVKSWKGVSARRINQKLHRRGALWMEDYFDRLIRDEEHFWNCARYIRLNPTKARLRSEEYLLHECDAVRLHLDKVGVRKS